MSSIPERRIRLRHGYRPFAVEGEGLFLIGSRDRQIFEGQVYADLLPFLRDGLNEATIAASLEAAYPPSVIYYALRVLEERQVLVEAASELNLAQAAFWDELEVHALALKDRLASTKVGVTSTCAVKA